MSLANARLVLYADLGQDLWKCTLANFILVLIWLRFEFIQTDIIPFLCFLCMTHYRSLDSPQTGQSILKASSHWGSLSLDFVSLVLLIHLIIFLNSFVLVEIFLYKLVQVVSGSRGTMGHAEHLKERTHFLLLTQRRSAGSLFFLLGFFVTTCYRVEVKSVQRVTWTDGKVELDCVCLEVY